ncbi:hypothetical protein V8G54_005684 [Vigna mungo]|uniref:Uncharacterized protein n=1 Tax=Vigna mungo TaxID=3915 RepID=A0AAQ3S5R3_VIGMU
MGRSKTYGRPSESFLSRRIIWVSCSTSWPLLPTQCVVHHTLNRNRLMNLMPLSFPRGTTWRLLASSARNPTKQPTTVSVALEYTEGEGVAVMLGGTSVRKGWPLARKLEPFKVMDKGELSGTRPNEPSCTVLLKLGAMGSSCGSWRFLERNEKIGG